MAQQLRDYQEWSLNQLRSNIGKGIQAQLLMLATGGGKTTVASAVMQGAHAKGKRAYFIVDSLELVDQAAARFMADGLEVGVIQGQHWMTDYGKQIQVATIQTLKNRWNEIHPNLRPDLIIIDEAHVCHQAHKYIIDECRLCNAPVIGLSATPFTKGLGKIYDDIVVGATTAQLIDKGHLVPAKCYAPFIPDLKNVKTTSDGDWQADALGELMGDAKIVGDVVENWFKLAEGRQTIVFASNVAHSRLLCDAFNRAGVKSEHIDGYDPDKEARTAKINAFRAGDIQVLCNVAVLTKGFDAPATGCVVLARPTKSLMLHIQMIGRGLRTADEKHDCIIIDHAGNCIRNGLPTDELPTTLHNGEKGENPDRKKQEKTEPVDKACGKCGYVSKSHVCPACGFKPERREDVEVIDGQLYEITTGEKAEKFSTEQLQDLYGELLGYAQAKGFKPGWAYHKCKEYAGRAPQARNHIGPKPPSEKTMGIIKHLNIKNAHRRKK